MAYKVQQFKTFIKGVNASVDRYDQPPGSVPRLSNLLLSKRGAFVACDGSKLLHAFNGVPTVGRLPILALYYYQPTGVAGYYVALIRVNIPLGSPQNLTLATAAGGSLPAATYYYVVTALDGVGGETRVSPEANIATGANGKNTLTWNIVPNAVKYNVYRNTAPGFETLLMGAGVPVLQPALGSLTVSFVDDGSTSSTVPLAVTGGVIISVSGAGIKTVYTASFTVASTAGLAVGMSSVYTPGSNNNFGGTWIISQVIAPNNIIATLGPGPARLLFPFSFTLGGTFATGFLAPAVDNTQQLALYKMPVLPTPTITTPYSDANIVALFPANPIAASPVGQSGGGGAGGSGGGGGSDGTGGGDPTAGGRGLVL